MKKSKKGSKSDSPEDQRLFEKTYSTERFGFKIKLSRQRMILVVTVSISLMLLIIATMTENLGVMANIILLCTFIVAVPQFFLMYESYKNVKEMEQKFPVFLRDVIESLSAGLPLHKAIIDASKFDYGKLTPEVKKIANQISWGLPLQKVLDQFAERVKRSPRLFTSVKIINESYSSGGDLVSIFNTVTDHSLLLDEAERERRSLLNQYVVLMYAISIIFMVIVVAINKLMMPIFQATSGSVDVGEALGMTNPCDKCLGFDCTVCKLYETTSEYVFSIEPTSISAYYISLFFFMSLVQSIFSGLVAGQIGEGSIAAGMKHSLILVSITLGTFYFLVYFKILTI